MLTALKYLKEVKLFLILVIFIMVIVDVTILLDPNLSNSIDTLIYINILSILVIIIFILIGYGNYKRKISKFITSFITCSKFTSFIIKSEL